MHEQAIAPIAIHLLKGVLYREQSAKLWEEMLRLRAHVADYLRVIGLELTLDEEEGYAFLKQRKQEDDDASPLPRLIPSRSLSYGVSLLCVLLRKKLVEADASGADTRVFIKRSQIVETMQVYLPAQAHEARMVDKIDADIKKVLDYGFLRELKGQEGEYEVRRILKAVVDADWLVSLEEKLKAYQDHGHELV